MNKIKITTGLLFVFQIVFSQQYDSVIIEKDSIDTNNNNIYKIGNVYIYDYEIIENNNHFKLNKNCDSDFEFISAKKDSINIDNIHLIIKPTTNNKRTNENQTQISYLEGPKFSSFSSTGLIDNDSNIWLHPIRNGFFSSLETCPFPYVKLPVKIGQEWSDSMMIGSAWGNEKWGTWENGLLLQYDYKVIGKEKVKTGFGIIDCFVIKSTAKSRKGETYLKSFFSETYGFVRLEYRLLTDIRINLWLIKFSKNNKFNDIGTFFRTKEYLKK